MLSQSWNRLQREVEIPVRVLRLAGLGTGSVVLMEPGEAHVGVKTQNSGLGVLGLGPASGTSPADRGKDLPAAEGWQVGSNRPVRPVWPEILERRERRAEAHGLSLWCPLTGRMLRGPGRGSGRKP